MNQEGFKSFESNQNEHNERVRKVGELKLVRGAGRKEYVLASMDILSRHMGRFPGFFELAYTLEDVVRYSLWDEDRFRQSEGSPSILHNADSVQRECQEVIAHLETNGLIAKNQGGVGEVTELGRVLLDDVILPEEVSTAAFTRDLF